MKKICEICGKEFEAKSPLKKICYDDHYRTCPHCGKTILWNDYHPFTGCKKCNALIAAQKRKKTMMEKYGAETTLQSKQLRAKVEDTMKDRYGATNAMQSDEIQQKAQQTNLKRYGHKNVMSNPEIAKRSAESRHENIEAIQEKVKQTWMEKYGVENISQLPETIDKITDTFIKRYGVKRAVHVPEFRNKMIKTMEERYGSPYYVLTDNYRQNSHFRISETNRKFQTKLKKYGIEAEMEFKIGTKCFDLKISETNTLIEINPTYTHNIIGNHWSSEGLDKYYHRDKTQVAEESGYRCIHVWDWDGWKAIVQMILPATHKVHARKCTIYRLNKSVGDEFLRRYHIQGTCRGQLLYLGLVYEDELIQVMTFGKSRFDKKFDVELMRFCNKYGYRIPGGASKLFTYATKIYELSNVISYCDRSKFTGDVYEKIGMKLERITPPQEIWSKDTSHITANLLRARGYDQLFGTNYGKGTSNEQLMIENGWLPVYDCGQRVYTFK